MVPHARSGHPLLPLALLAWALTAAGAAAANAAPATLTTDARCYPQNASLRMTAGNLTPNAPLTVTLDGQPLRYGDGSTPVADGAGSFAGSFAVPALPPAAVQERHRLAVSDAAHGADARFTVSRPAGADLQARGGDPRTLRARFRVWGFALGATGRATRLSVWLHWIDPAGHARAEAALGTTGGDCGTLTTRPRRVFPFAPEAGRWRLVFDTHARYRVHASGPRAKISVDVRPLAR